MLLNDIRRQARFQLRQNDFEIEKLTSFLVAFVRNVELQLGVFYPLEGSRTHL